uniref:Uncharacterized protein n=1 Tax=Rhizophora mucronata TaxID=61149 RepID=A0A2P2QFN8_RHIMU
MVVLTAMTGCQVSREEPDTKLMLSLLFL